MATIVPIDDPADDRLSDFVALADPELRRRRELSHGAEGGFLIAEGVVVIRQLLRSSYRVRCLLLTEPRLAALERDLEGVKAPVYVGSQSVVSSVSGFNLHRGALASADRPPPADPVALARRADRVVVTEGVNDHENLGSLFRNAAAFGVGAVLLDPSSADPLYRRSVRVSLGHVLHVAFTRAAPWPDTIGMLRDLGFEVLALTPAADAENLRRVEPRPRQALLVGAEGAGLSGAAMGLADRRVRIAMAPGVDSLNVAAATAVALHHLWGQG